MTIEDGNLNSNIIVIDTTAYAGNFERELCAYLTGQIAECTVGNEFIKRSDPPKYLQWWEENINPQEDTEGSEFYRPCTIWKTNNSKDYQSVAIFVEQFPSQEVIDEMLERAKYFCNDTDHIYEVHGVCKNPNIPKKIDIMSYNFLSSEYTKEVIETINLNTILKKKM